MTANDASTKARVLADRYRLGPRRGSGLDIAIFEAFDLREQRLVAVKIVHPEICEAEGFAETFQDTMVRTAAVVHPNVARLLDWGTADWDGRPVQFTVSENLTGGSLRDLLDRGRQLSPSQGLMVALDVCKALDAAHRAGLVHGDIRPANLVFGDDGRVRITDLGLAHLVSEPMWSEPVSVPLSRARFAAPEQAMGRPTEAKSDVYALCLSVLEAMTGQLPFVGDSTVATLANRIDRLMPVSADLGALAAILERAGRPDPADRWTAGEFGRALVQAAEKLPRPAPLPLVSAGLFADAQPAVESQLPPTGPTTAAVPLPPPSLVAEANQLSSVPVATTLPSVPLPTEPLAPIAVADMGGPSTAATPQGVVTAPAQEPTSAPHPGPTPGPAPSDTSVATAGATDIPPPPVPDREPPLLAQRRSRRKLVAVVAVLFVAAAIGGAVAWFLGRTEAIVVPDLVGLEQGAALNEISEFGWETTVLEETNDDVEAGLVIRTDPAAGVELDGGAAFLLVVSNGPAPRVLPEITGLTVEQATGVLAQLDLTLQLGESIADEVAPAGTIVTWMIPAQPALGAGDTVVPGTAVVVTLSAGPAPRVLPDLTGLSVADATAQLASLGLVVAQAPDEFSATVPVGGIARQDPAPGTEVPRDSTVTIVASLGPDLVTVPPLADLTVQQVTDALSTAGLVLGSILGDPAGVAVLAEVNGEPLVANVTLPRGTAVDVTFEVPAPPPTEPPTESVPTT